MPQWVSVAGKTYPAMEIVQLPLSQEDLIAGKSPVYRGPDRAALAYMVENGHAQEDANGPIHYYGEDERYKGKRFKITDYPGKDCFTDPDVIRMARTYGYKTVAEYLLEMYGIKKEDIEAKSKELLNDLVNHDKPVNRKPDLKVPSGGDEDARTGNRGANDYKGGFEGSPAAIKARA